MSTITIGRTIYSVEFTNDGMFAARLTSKRGASYSLVSNVNRPDMLGGFEGAVKGLWFRRDADGFLTRVEW